ncbi:hypothetical protein PR048_002313 [Dryococelus australis]|uniref:Transposase n=1 Tax=Dryococelus australis TaxID=614101 RepID=A0ABQ9IJY0_9NEOP|nr:hypothetical protein PR048_002313 [Dryococelus australis]
MPGAMFQGLLYSGTPTTMFADWSGPPDPVEHIWDELDRRVRARQARPKSIAQLMEWFDSGRRVRGDFTGVIVNATRFVIGGEEPRRCSGQNDLASTWARRVRFLSGSLPDFRICESCRTMPMVCGFSRGSTVSPPLRSGAAPCPSHFTLISSKDTCVWNRPNLSSQLLQLGRVREARTSRTPTTLGYSSWIMHRAIGPSCPEVVPGTFWTVSTTAVAASLARCEPHGELMGCLGEINSHQRSCTPTNSRELRVAIQTAWVNISPQRVHLRLNERGHAEPISHPELRHCGSEAGNAMMSRSQSPADDTHPLLELSRPAVIENKAISSGYSSDPRVGLGAIRGLPALQFQTRNMSAVHTTGRRI